MTRTIDVVLDGTVLRPKLPLELRKDAEYSITIEDVAEEQSTGALGTRENGSKSDDNLVAHAWNFYNTNLKAVLEPARLGDVVAIHPQSGDFEVAWNSSTARNLLSMRQKDQPFVVIRIGVVPVDNALSLRNRNLLSGDSI